MKHYFVDIKWKTGDWSRAWLNKNTWIYWGGLCGLKKDNPLQYGRILCGLDYKSNPICIKTKDVSSISFGDCELQPKEGQVAVFANGKWQLVINNIDISADPNPLNAEENYDDPLN